MPGINETVDRAPRTPSRTPRTPFIETRRPDSPSVTAAYRPFCHFRSGPRACSPAGPAGFAYFSAEPLFRQFLDSLGLVPSLLAA